MPITCTPANLADLAACYCGMSNRSLEGSKTYLLCQIANVSGDTNFILAENGDPLITESSDNLVTEI